MSANREEAGIIHKPKHGPTSFKPGQSGNPTGRPKRTQEEIDLVEACRAKTTEALATIQSLMVTANKDSVKLNAAQYILDRGWGKAVQAMELTGPDGKPMEVKHTFTIEVVSTD